MSWDNFQVRGRGLLAEVPLIDGHNDFPWMLRGWFKNQLSTSTFDIKNLPIGQTDISRLTYGMLGGQFWSAFVPCPRGPDKISASMSSETLRTTLQQIDLIHMLIERFPETFALAETSEDILTIFRSGRIASLIGVEGLHQIGGSASILRMYHRLGVRYITLCHSNDNAYADAAPSNAQPHGGLSEEGREMLKEMNRIGMIIDLSHTSELTQKQALATSEAPLIFSHSSCYALCPHQRNVSDSVLAQLRQNGGLIMICFAPAFVVPSAGKAINATLQHVVDHIVYAGQRIGYAHVGIGSDFDGMLEGPNGLDDTSCYPALLEELLRRGLSEEEVKMVMGLNIIRVMEEVEGFAKRALQEGRQALCDQIEEVWTPEQRDMITAKGLERTASKAMMKKVG